MTRKPPIESYPALRGKLGSPDNSKQKYSNSTATQRARILKYFALNPSLSTTQARDDLGILHPGGRIMELRRKGYRIDTLWVEASDSNGVLHRVGLYVFKGLNAEANHAQ